MRRLIPLALLLLSTGAVAQSDWTTFATPAQSHGDSSWSGFERAFIVAPAGSLEGWFQFGDGTWTSLETASFAWRLREPDAGGTRLAAPATADEGRVRAASASLAGNGEWAALYVEARLIQVDAAGADVFLDLHQASDAVHERHSSIAVPDSVGALATSSGAAVHIEIAANSSSIRVEGLRHLAWHNVSVACGTSACPPSAETARQEVRSGSGIVYHTSVQYVRLEAAGEGRVQFQQGLVIGLAPVVDASLTGWVRLPDAVGPAVCSACPLTSGETVRLAGQFEWRGLSADGGRLRVQATGDAQQASIGEVMVITTAAVAATAVAALAVKSAAAAAFIRRRRRMVGSRRLLYDVIRDLPGCSFRQLQRESGLGNGTVDHHLAALLRLGLVERRRLQNTVRYFDTETDFGADWRARALLRNGQVREVLEIVASRPWGSQTDIVRQAEEAGHSRTATQRRLAHMAEAGLVAIRTVGRRKHYAAVMQPARA